MKDKLKKYGLTEAELERILVKQTKQKIRKINRLYSNHEELKIGVVSDTHLCSNYEDIEALHHFYIFAKNEGCKCVLHAGDIVDGRGMFPNHEFEIHTHGATAQANYVKGCYPDHLPTYVCLGNHDNSHFKRSGVDIGQLIETPKIKIIGNLQADIEISGIKFRLIHPSGGMPYSFSYRGQKIAEQIPSKEKPDVLIVGHLHISNYFFYRNIHVINAGAFQRQTPYLTAKGINPTIGGWIITLRHKDGQNIGIDLSFILFPK